MMPVASILVVLALAGMVWVIIFDDDAGRPRC
jgi:hypothetical protein